MQPTPHGDAHRLLKKLLACMQGILGEKLVGLYLYGSLAVGDFESGISDVDLLAALASGLEDSELVPLRVMHGDLERDEPEWADRVEVAYVAARALRTFRSERSPIAVISPGEPFHVKDAGADWLANWYAVREEGRVLFGPPPETLIAPISREEFADCIRGYAAAWGERVHGVRDRKEQAYAILTLCRALHLHRTGEQASKREAARWAQEELPEWSELVGSALAWRRAWREGDVDQASTRAEIVRFVQDVSGRILGRAWQTLRPSEESALVVLVPDAEPLVAGFRSRFDRSAARGMPAHITVLYPFLHPDALSPELVDELRSLFLGLRRFRFALAGVCGFPDVVYLAPEPLAPFDALTQGVATRFPETPPYGGVIANPVPHLTIAQRPPAPDLVEVTDRFVLAAGARLPLECAADEVALALKREGRWSIGPSFALGRGARARIRAGSW